MGGQNNDSPRTPPGSFIPFIPDLLHSWNTVSGRPSTSDLEWISSQMQLSAPAPGGSDREAVKHERGGLQVLKKMAPCMKETEDNRGGGSHLLCCLI